MMWLVGIGTLGLVLGVGMIATLRRARGWTAVLRRLVLGIGVAGVGGICLSLWLALRGCEQFWRAAVVADVRCQWTGPKRFLLTLTPRRREQPPPAQTFSLRGDQWMLSGHVVKWHPWLTALGVPSYHRLSRVSGRFADTAEETRHVPTAFTLGGERDRVWEWFHRLDPVLPFVEAAYGSSAFLPVDPRASFEVLVSPAGYFIRRQPLQPPPD